MIRKECIAMLLAGGQGSRLGILTRKLAKPAVPFGGKYRIIDFTLSNCCNSDIDTVGVLTQYQPLVLNSYIGIGSYWDLDKRRGGVTVLPPYVRQNGGEWYKGTANAIYQNMDFIDYYNPRNVLVLSGDHIYKMDYSLMLKYHKEKEADATIAVIEVPWEETSRFGIMNTSKNGEIEEFEEKPKKAKNNLASMGVYIFCWEKLKKHLIEDENDDHSSHDFGKDIIPKMIKEGERMYAYPFNGYWKDVGTIESLWEANMDLLEDEPLLNLNDRWWQIYTVNPIQPPQYISPKAKIKRSLINDGCQVIGNVEHSVIFHGVRIREGSLVKNSVIMPNAKIGSNVIINQAIIGEETVIGDNCIIGDDDGKEAKITVIGENIVIPEGKRFTSDAVICTENCKEYGCMEREK